MDGVVNSGVYCMFYVIIQNIQVSRNDVEQYTGEGEPYCEMTLRADADGSTPPDLAVPVTLTGVKTPTTIMLEREARDIWKELSPSSEHERGKPCIVWACAVLYLGWAWARPALIVTNVPRRGEMFVSLYLSVCVYVCMYACGSHVAFVASMFLRTCLFNQ